MWRLLQFIFCLMENIFHQEGVAMGSPLSPVVVNFYMEYFEHKVCSKALWLHHAFSDMLLTPLSPRMLLNGFHKNMVYYGGWRSWGTAISGCVCLLKGRWGRGRKVYQKPTRTDLYLHRASFHLPAQKRAFCSTLLQQTTVISDVHNWLLNWMICGLFLKRIAMPNVKSSKLLRTLDW